MKSWLKFSSCLLLILLAQAFGYAQTGGVAEEELKEALIQHREQLEGLATQRGVPDRAIIKIPFDHDEAAYLLRGAVPINHHGNLSREQISRALNDFPQQTAILFFSYKADTLRVWLIDEAGIQAYHESDVSRAKLSAAIADLRTSLGVDSRRSKRVPRLLVMEEEAPENAAKLPLKLSVNNLTSILLPPPVAQKLVSVRHLIVAPVLDIGIIPFALLQPFGDVTYLIDKMSVSVAPSVYDVMEQIEKWRPDFHHPLIVGNPSFSHSPKWKAPSLPGAEKEARYVAGVVNARPLIGRRATKQEIIARAKEADFLHFATHGIANSNDPLTGGFLVFSAKQFERGWWTAREIQESKLTAQIAILSACQTGLGKVHNAGMIGLSRAFQIAGVPRVAMSLWSVDDKATFELMRAFVTHLRQHVPSEALRLAMLDVKKHQADPAKWASFVLFGTPR